MPKYKSQAVCERNIAQLQAKIERTKTRLEKMENELRNLLSEKEQAEARQLYDAYKRSNKTFDQAMTFFSKKG